MRLLVYAPAARMGGARAHMLGMVPELAAIAPDDEVLLIAHPDLIAELARLPENWTLQANRGESKSFLSRLFWEQRVLPHVAERWRADVLLSFGSFVPLRAPCATVLEAGNALPFTRAYWQVLSREPVRVQLEDRARWALLRASLRAAERVLAPTRAMRQDVVTRMPDLLPKVDVALWGVAPAFRAARWIDPHGDAVLGLSKPGLTHDFDLLISPLPHLPPQPHPSPP